MVKLGGSLLTDKSQPFSLKAVVLDRVALELSRYKGRMVIVHGGGSYAHPLAQHYSLKTTPRTVDAKGVTMTRLGVLALHTEVALSLLRAGIPTYSIQPAYLLRGCEVLLDALACSLTPITYGDVAPSRRGCFVVSGDRLMRIVAGYIKPSRAVFALDVDGVFDGIPKSGRLLREIPLGWSPAAKSNGGFDVTGGVVGKIKEAQRIASMGVDVYFVNGLRPKRVLKALNGEATVGTVIRGRLRA